jgi:hypothetical protein
MEIQGSKCINKITNWQKVYETQWINSRWYGNEKARINFFLINDKQI